MVFLLYKLYFLSPHTKLQACLHLQTTSFCMIYKLLYPHNIPTRSKMTWTLSLKYAVRDVMHQWQAWYDQKIIFYFNSLIVILVVCNFVVVYRPPGPQGSFLDDLDVLLSTFPGDGTPLVLLGDFSIHLDKP